MRILLVEDDALLGAGLRAALGKSAFDVTWLCNGLAALDVILSEPFKVLVLDINLPGLNGLELLQKIRQCGCKAPVLILTARDTSRDKALCLQHGANDFLVKTTCMEELIERLRSLIGSSGHDGPLTVGALSMDVQAHSVTLNGEPISVSKREFGILRSLMEGAGRVLTRAQLEQSLYGLNGHIESNAVEVHIHNLRLKIGSSTLKTVRGVGYTLAGRES